MIMRSRRSTFLPACAAALALGASGAALPAMAGEVSGSGRAKTNTEACYAAKDDARSKIPQPPAKPGEKPAKLKVKYNSCKCEGQPDRTCTVTATY